MTGPPDRGQHGATLIEVLIATGFLTVALMGLTMAMGAGVASVLISQEDLLARQKAREALESVFTARNTQNILWEDIRNIGDGGIFMDGFQVLRETGVDGIANTADDASAPPETLALPGPDGNLGTADDETRVLAAFTRSVTISDVLLPNGAIDPDIRRIEVEVRYPFRGFDRTIRLSSMISRFS